MEIPQDELVGDLYEKLDDSLKELFQDRAAIIEFEGQQPRLVAECLAMLNILKRYPLALTGVHGIWIEMNGMTGVLFATDLDYARRHIAQLGGQELRPLDLNDAVTQTRDGVLMLSVWQEHPC